MAKTAKKTNKKVAKKVSVVSSVPATSKPKTGLIKSIQKRTGEVVAFDIEKKKKQ